MATEFLIDTSAWGEFFRKTGSPTNSLVRSLIEDRERICITEPVAMEILAGATDAAELMKLEHLVDGLPMLKVQARTDYRDAAMLHRTVRGKGFTVRKRIDCLIATVALRKDATLIHRDADFDVIKKAVPNLKVRRE